MLAQHILILKTPLRMQTCGSVTIMCQLNGQFGGNMKCLIHFHQTIPRFALTLIPVKD